MFQLPKNVPILIGGKPAQLADLKLGMELFFKKDRAKKEIAEVREIKPQAKPKQ